MPDKKLQIRGPITDFEEMVYIERPQDREVLNFVQGASYVTVLGSRQTGKTSLLYRLRQGLAPEIYVPVLIDLTLIQEADRAELYRYVSGRIVATLSQREAGLEGLESASNQIEFLDLLQQVAQQMGPSRRIVVMLDEFEAVPQNLRQGFFGAIRTVYNERGVQPEFKQYVYILAGATDPNSLIPQDSGLSPFNISEVVYMDDFDLAGIEEMVHCLGTGNLTAEKSLARNIYDQTHGHPNLSVKLCVFIKDHIGISVEEAVKEFATNGDENVQRVVDRLESNAQEKQWVREIIDGKKKKFDRSQPMIARLELLGVIRRGEDGCLIRNEIFANALGNLFSQPLAEEETLTGEESESASGDSGAEQDGGQDNGNDATDDRGKRLKEAIPLFIGAIVVGLIFVFIGVWLINSGPVGEIELEFFGSKIKTGNIGFGSIFIGAVIIVLLVRRIFKSIDR